MSNVVWISSGNGWPGRSPTIRRGGTFMAELEFEARLDRLFAQAPNFPDAAIFALKVDHRLERGWTVRRTLIGGLGLIGGLFGVAQVVSSGVLGRAEMLSAQSSKLLSQNLHQFIPLHLSLLDLPF